MLTCASGQGEPGQKDCVRKLLRADTSYTAQFDRPAFTLQARWAEFSEAAFDHFSPYIRPEAITFEATGGQPSDWVAKCHLFDAGVAVRFRLTDLELWVRDLHALPAGTGALEFTKRALAILDAVAARVTVATHGLALGMHWRLDPGEGGPRGFLERWIGAAPDGLEVSGATFAAPADGLRVQVEPSMVYSQSDGLFVRVGYEVAGTTPIAEVYRSFEARAGSALGALGLELAP